VRLDRDQVVRLDAFWCKSHRVDLGFQKTGVGRASLPWGLNGPFPRTIGVLIDQAHVKPSHPGSELVRLHGGDAYSVVLTVLDGSIVLRDLEEDQHFAQCAMRASSARAALPSLFIPTNTGGSSVILCRVSSERNSPFFTKS